LQLQLQLQLQSPLLLQLPLLLLLLLQLPLPLLLPLQLQLPFLLSSPEGDLLFAVGPFHQRKAVKPHNRKTPRQSSEIAWRMSYLQPSIMDTAQETKQQHNPAQAPSLLKRPATP